MSSLKTRVLHLFDIISPPFCRETNLHDKCCETSRANYMEKMDNKTIQKLRELYFKVCARLFRSNFLRYILLPKLCVQDAGIITLTKLHVHLGTCWRLFLLEFLEITPVNKPHSYSRYWTATSFLLWLLRGVFSNAKDIYSFLMIFLHMSLHYKLVPVQNREYEYGLPI